MSLTVSNNYEDPIPGHHTAVCVQIIDLGLQPSERYNPSQKVVLSWEIVDEKKKDGTPFVVSKWMNGYLGKTAKLTEFLTAWRGRHFTAEELKAFNLTKLLGQQCTLNLIENEKGKIEVSNCFAYRAYAGAPPVQATITPAFFDFDTATLTEFEQLPEWAKDKIEMALDFPSLLARMLNFDFDTAEWPQFSQIHERYQRGLARHPEYVNFYNQIKTAGVAQAQQEPAYPDDNGDIPF